MKSKGLFVTGTDTEVGKTHTTVGLIRHFREAGLRAVGLKPVECGSRDDAKALLEASGEEDLTFDDIAPVWFPEPLAPSASSVRREIDFNSIVESYRALEDRFDRVVVEGAGGWMVPIDAERTMADLAVALGLPVLVVAANRLGVLNHTLLTVEAIRHSGLECVGVYLNSFPATCSDLSCKSNARQLEDILPGIPVIDGDLSGLAGSQFA